MVEARRSTARQDPRNRRAQLLAYVTHQMGAEQGVGNVVRSAVAGLAKISWFAPFGMGFAERFVRRSLAQVTRYFADDTIRSAA